MHGPALAPIITVMQSTAPFAINTVGSTFIQCPTGMTLLSGGGGSDSPFAFATLNRKSDPNGWRYDALNFSTVPVTITVYANCLT
jgi:hypothetical protein